MRYVSSALRKYDSVYRYGGEEFLLCLPGTPLKDADMVVERIRDGLQNLPIRLPNGNLFNITASFGIAEMQPRRPVEETVASADMALLRAKENGREVGKR
jgi:diguanylate cyclase (GGDEF)-like protein